MSAFYSSNPAGDQLRLHDMATNHHGSHQSSVFAGGLCSPPATAEAAVDRHAGPLQPDSRGTGFPLPAPNFLSYSANAASDFRDFCSPPTATIRDSSKVSPTGAAMISRRCRDGEECNNEFGGCGGSGCLDLSGMEMRDDVFKTAPPPPLTAVNRTPSLGSPTSSSPSSASSHRYHPDQSPHLHQQHHHLRSELLHQQQQQQRHGELLLQQARQWYLQQQSPSTTAASPIDAAGNVDLVNNGRSPNGAAPSLFGHEAAAGPLGVDIAHHSGLQCHWPPPPAYNTGPSTPVTQRQPSDLRQQELSPTQKAESAVPGVQFYPWMAVVGRYILHTLLPYFNSRINNLYAPNKWQTPVKEK